MPARIEICMTHTYIHTQHLCIWLHALMLIHMYVSIAQTHIAYIHTYECAELQVLSEVETVNNILKVIENKRQQGAEGRCCRYCCAFFCSFFVLLLTLHNGFCNGHWDERVKAIMSIHTYVCMSLCLFVFMKPFVTFQLSINKWQFKYIFT